MKEIRCPFCKQLLLKAFFCKGEIKCKETFEKRELTTEPKFLQKKRTTTLPDSDLENKSTFKKRTILY